jgi:hypothetical protein
MALRILVSISATGSETVINISLDHCHLLKDYIPCARLPARFPDPRYLPEQGQAAETDAAETEVAHIGPRPTALLTAVNPLHPILGFALRLDYH